MPAVCFYLHAHQPFRIRDVSFFDLGKEPSIFEKKLNKKHLRRVIHNSYLPSFKLMRELLSFSPEKFRFSFSMTGTLIDQFEEYYPGSFGEFIHFTKNEDIELITETYSHSPAFFYSKNEFRQQVLSHKNQIQQHFDKNPTVFRNADLSYHSDMAHILSDLNFRAAIIEGDDRLLNNSSPNYLYSDAKKSNFRLLVRNRYFSEIFSEFRSPRTQNCKKKAKTVIHDLESRDGDLIVIGLDVKSLGEKHHKHSGIFNFTYHFIKYALQSKNISFIHPSQAITFDPAGTLDISYPVHRQGYRMDLMAGDGSVLQKKALKYLYSIEPLIYETKNAELLSKWRKLQSTDHFLKMASRETRNSISSRFLSSPHNVHLTYQRFIDAVACLEIYARKITGKSVNINPPVSI